MAKHIDAVIYSPYGAFELKAKYQRNINLGTVSVVGLILLVLCTNWILQSTAKTVLIPSKPIVINSRLDFPDPPTIIIERPQVAVDRSDVQLPDIGIPVAVADDELPDDATVMASRDELAEYVAAGVGDDEGYYIVVDIDYDAYLPPIDTFIAIETPAEMIHYVKPAYPRLALQAGLTGMVWIKALVGINGEVLDAVVYRGSGTASLDAAALSVATQNRFKPAIQNGRPVAIWVTYKVVFEL